MAPKVDFWEIQALNRRKTFFLIFFLFVVFGLVGYLLDRYYLGSPAPFLTVVALVFASFESMVAFWVGDKIILASVGAREVDLTNFKEKQLANIVEELRLASGLPPVRVYVMPSRNDLNAFATGRNEKHASIAVTRGLLEKMDREELQGVIGHELAHVRNRDILTMMVATVIFGAVIILSRIVLRGGFSWSGDERRRGGNAALVLIGLVLAILAPLFSRLLVLAVSRSREYMADAGSVEFTRNPEGLIQALTKIAQEYEKSPLPKAVRRKTEALSHLFIYSPLEKRTRVTESFWGNIWSTHPPLEKRIARLKVMAGTAMVG
jgi:heat shock protein HtpX